MLREESGKQGDGDDNFGKRVMDGSCKRSHWRERGGGGFRCRLDDENFILHESQYIERINA